MTLFSAVAMFLRHEPNDYFGIDQIAFNYILNTRIRSTVELEDVWDYTILEHYKRDELFIDMSESPPIVAKEGKEVVPIVHNCGGKDWRYLIWSNHTFSVNPNMQFIDIKK